MSSAQPAVDIIIPTMAVAARTSQLKRAIASIRNAASHTVRIIVVVNGGRNDRALTDWILDQDDVHCRFEATPSLPHALLSGRECVTAPFFATLDDDDEYLDGAIDLRLAAITKCKEAALVITNGYRRANGVDEIIYPDLAPVTADPLTALFSASWLNSANALYRSSAVQVKDFCDHNAYAEWTWLAYKLALRGNRIGVVDQPSFRIHDTPGSLSKSDRYAPAYLPLFQRMLALAPPAAVRRLIRRKMSAAWHDSSVRALAEHNKARAWTCHMRSLMLSGGMAYLPYTRRLLPGWPNRGPA